MSLSKTTGFDRKRLSLRTIMEMTPEKLSEVHPYYLEYVRGRDLEKFSNRQLFALTAEQVRFLRPNQFSRLGSDRLAAWIAHVEEHALYNEDFDEKDVELISPLSGEAYTRKVFGAKRTLQEALVRALSKEEKLRKQEAIASRSIKNKGMITDSDVRATIVAQKLQVGMLFLHRLAERGDIQLQKIIGTHVINKDSLMAYLRKQRRPGAKLNADGKPIRKPKYEDIMSKWHNTRDARKEMNDEMKAQAEFEMEQCRLEAETISHEDRYELVTLPDISDIPELKISDDFAERLQMDRRAFVRACNEGFFDHWRIGNVVRMTEEDFQRSCQRQKEAHMKSQIQKRGRKPLVTKN